MKKFLLFILILVAVVGVCVVTCPDKASHSEALKDVLNTAITEELSSSGNSDGDAGFVMFGSMIGTGIGGPVIDNMLKVENHFVCSIGTMTYDGDTKVVSFGIMNHVFTPVKRL